MGRKPKNVILLGFMGSGKSTVGRLLSRKLGFHFVDIDKQVEKNNDSTVEEIFNEKGQEFFQKEEHLVVQDLSKMKARVIATGGGIIESADSMKLLLKMGVTVYLKATVQEIYSRTTNSRTRPLLNVENRREVIEQMLSEQDKKFEEYSDIVIYTDDRSVLEICEEILENL
ncbi:shikimate kinase [bacterium]|nr:shikimate kinase [bacterium]